VNVSSPRFDTLHTTWFRTRSHVSIDRASQSDGALLPGQGKGLDGCLLYVTIFSTVLDMLKSELLEQVVRGVAMSGNGLVLVYHFLIRRL
jgi:hypothetical protein